MANNLQDNHTIEVTSFEEKMRILIELKENNIPIGSVTWNNRFNESQYEKFPNIVWINGMIVSTRSRTLPRKVLSKSEFFRKAGIDPNYKRSEVLVLSRHKFI